MEVLAINMKHDEVIKTILTTNSRRYNLEKAVEELLELAEVLMKKVLKEGGPKEPKDQEVIDEIGDVAIRMLVLMELFGEEAVNTRVSYKLDKFAEYIKANKYKGSL